MPRSVTSAFLAIALLMFSASPSWAQGSGHGAHEHGVGRINLAIEGDDVELELASPGADIVGFEHEAESAADRAAIKRALELLQAGDLFRFTEKAGCKLEEAEASTSLLHDEHEKHKDHGHGEKHAEGHGHGAKHKEGHGHEEKHEEGHGEFTAHLHYHCARPKELAGMMTKFFSVFPKARELDVQFILPSGQGAAELTPSNPKLNFP